MTLFECLNAADELATDGINVAVIDPFTIKPLDRDTIKKHAKRVGGRVITVEDHYPAGGNSILILLSCFFIFSLFLLAKFFCCLNFIYLLEYISLALLFFF